MSEAKSSINKGGTITFHSPWNHHHCNKMLTELGDSDKSVLQHMIFYMYGMGEFPKAKKLQ
jgi:hypothetical protein